jgi:hypothetical protein
MLRDIGSTILTDFPLVVVVALRSGDFLQLSKCLSVTLPQKPVVQVQKSILTWSLVALATLPQKPFVQVQKYPHLVFGHIGQSEQAPTSSTPSTGCPLLLGFG